MAWLELETSLMTTIFAIDLNSTYFRHAHTFGNCFIMQTEGCKTTSNKKDCQKKGNMFIIQKDGI